MNYGELITCIFQVCIIPLLTVLTTYFVKWVNAKSAEIKVNIDDAEMVKYVDMLNRTITECVIATNQTYVEALKQQGKFDAEAQKIAFQKTYDAVIKVLSEDAKDYVASIYGDITTYLTTRIEAEVNLQK
jgi:hypothetical protein